MNSCVYFFIIMLVIPMFDVELTSYFCNTCCEFLEVWLMLNWREIKDPKV